MLTECAVRVEYLGLIRNVLECSEEEYSVTPGSTIEYLLERMAQKHGEEVRSLILTSDGYLRPSVQAYLNGDEVRTLQGLDTPIAHKGEITVVVGVSPFPGG